jgi:hypothetical protein
MRELFNPPYNPVHSHGSAACLDQVSTLTAQAGQHGGEKAQNIDLYNFGYLFEDLARSADYRLPECSETIGALKTLGSGMTEIPSKSAANSAIPAGYTFLQQFIEHDISCAAQSTHLIDQVRNESLEPVTVDNARSHIKNLRSAALELVSVYGGGPDADPELYEADGVLFKLGRNRKGKRVPDHIDSDTCDRDVLRQPDGTAVLGDGRNDQSLPLAQTHHAYKVFHNNVAAQQRGNPSKRFAMAQKKVIQHYQWIVLHDFLPRLVSRTAHKNALYEPRFYTDDMLTFMPFEFSMAAFQLERSLARQRYRYNSSLATEKTDNHLLYNYTGTGSQRMPIPQHAIIDWRNFYAIEETPANYARSIDTRLSCARAQPGNEADLLRMAAIRTLLRGYQLCLPTGQAVATRIGAKTLSTAELMTNTCTNEQAALASSQLSGRTPLWYYILKESAIREQGQKLGETGSAIAAETLVALIKRSRYSILQEPNWQPVLGDTHGHFTMTDLLKVCEFEEVCPEYA